MYWRNNNYGTCGFYGLTNIFIMTNVKVPKVNTLPVTKTPRDTIWNINTVQIGLEAAVAIGRSRSITINK